MVLNMYKGFFTLSTEKSAVGTVTVRGEKIEALYAGRILDPEVGNNIQRKVRDFASQEVVVCCAGYHGGIIRAKNRRWIDNP